MMKNASGLIGDPEGIAEGTAADSSENVLLLKTEALRAAILSSATFSIIATDARASFNYSMSAPSACSAIALSMS